MSLPANRAPDDARSTAVHEAAHDVARWAFGQFAKGVLLAPPGEPEIAGRLGRGERVSLEDLEAAHARIRQDPVAVAAIRMPALLMAAVAYAGVIAEEREAGRQFRPFATYPAAREDMLSVARLFTTAGFGSAEVNAQRLYAMDLARLTVDQLWAHIQAIADAVLAAGGTLSGPACQAYLDAHAMDHRTDLRRWLSIGYGVKTGPH